MLLWADILLYACLVSAPLMYASVRPWAEIPLALISLAAFNLALAARPRALPALLRLPWVLLGAAMLPLILIQLVPFPPALVEKISPATFSFFSRYRPDGIASGMTLSVYPADTITGLVQYLTYAFVFLTVLVRLYPDGAPERKEEPSRLRKARYLQLGCLIGVLSLLFHSLYDFNLHITANGVYFVTLLALAAGAERFEGYDERFFRRTVNGIIVFGFGIALFAIVQMSGYNGRIYWVGIPAPSPVGPYYNSDHYAGFMELCVALAAAKAAAGILNTARVPRPDFARKFLWLATQEANDFLRFLFMAGVMAATIFMSTSRGGIMSFTLAMLTFFSIAVLVEWRTGKAGRAAVFLVTIGLLIAVLVVWLGPEPFLEKFHLLFADRHLDMEGPIGSRLTFYQQTLEVIRDFPSFGTGLRTFATHFSRYRAFDFTPHFLNYTHNDYLQLVSETGIGGAVFILVFLGLYVASLRRTARRLKGSGR